MDNGNNQNYQYQNNYMVCPNCKQYVPRGSAFCNFCGFRFPNNAPNQNVNNNMQNNTKNSSNQVIYKIGFAVFIIVAVVLIAYIVDRVNTKDLTTESQTDALGYEYPTDWSDNIEDESAEEYSEVDSEISEFSDQTLYDDNGCVIKLVSGDEDSVQFCFENNTDKDLAFKLIAMSINGSMCDYFDSGYRITSGTKLTESYDLSDIYVYANSNCIEYADFVFWIVDYENLTTNYTTPVLDAKTNMYKKDYIYSSKDDSFSYDGVALSVLENIDTSTTYEIGNNNDNVVYVNFENYTVNGCSMQNEYIPVIAVFPHQKANIDIIPSDDFKQLNNISSIDSVSTQLSVVKEYLGYTDSMSETMNVVE